MSETPQQKLQDVSRETSEKKNSKAEKPEASPSAKNKRSSVYIYLVVLFGAAFLMLLLAYFVQQRNNEAAISSLQSTMNLSREELMQENSQLEEKNESLTARIAELKRNYSLNRMPALNFRFCMTERKTRRPIWNTACSREPRPWSCSGSWTKPIRETRSSSEQLIECLEAPEADPLKNYLPDSSDRSQYDYGLDSPSPAERYQEIYEKLS